jgi:hypothetical protein
MSYPDVTQYQADREQVSEGSEWVVAWCGSSENRCIVVH